MDVDRYPLVEKLHTHNIHISKYKPAYIYTCIIIYTCVYTMYIVECCFMHGTNTFMASHTHTHFTSGAKTYIHLSLYELVSRTELHDTCQSWFTY